MLLNLGPDFKCGMQLTTMRVECEKAAESAGGDRALWECLGDRALATLHLVRAYRERSLHVAYSGLLPPQPYRSSGEPKNICSPLTACRPPSSGVCSITAHRIPCTQDPLWLIIPTTIWSVKTLLVASR